jgi:hypothetical protein
MEVHCVTDFGSMRSFVECEQCNKNFYKKDVTLTCGSFKCDCETKHESEKIGYNAKHGSENDQGFGHYPLFVQCSFEAIYFKFLNL